MNSIYNAKIIRGIIWVYFFFLPVFLYLDPMQITHGKNIYIIGRLATTFLFLVVLIQSYFSQKYWHVLALFIGILFHGIFGQYFLPCYYLAYLEIIIPISLFVALRSDKEFYAITTVSFIAMIYSILTSGQAYSTDPIMTQRFYGDICAAVFIQTIFAILGYNFVTKVRKEKDIMSAKFLDVGKNTSSIIHDFKGLLGTPLLYSELLESAKSQFDPKTIAMIEALNQGLRNLRDYVIKINQLNMLNTNKENFTLTELVADVSVLISSQLSYVTFELICGDIDLFFYKNLLLKVFYNIFINSIEAQDGLDNKKKVEIQISYDKNRHSIVIKDNGPGFPVNFLKKINSGHSIQSTKSSGSGVGLLIVRDLLMNHGSKVLFQNNKCGSGSKVIIDLPKK